MGQLQNYRGLEGEVRTLRSEAASLQQECTTLRTRLQAQEASLRDSEDAARGSVLLRRDLDAFQAAVSRILTDAPNVFEDAEEGKMAAAADPTPLNLSLLWTRSQRSASRIRQ